MPAEAVNSPQFLLRVRNLVTEFDTEDGPIRAVDGTSFDVPHGKTLGIVGESGCGKSVTAMSLMRLIPTPPGRIQAGQVFMGDTDLLALSEAEMRKWRGNKLSMIFQEPMTALNPVYTVGDQVMEVVRLHKKANKQEARDKAIEMFRLVGIPAPEERIEAYPHQLSGGMRQRVMIAMALACDPELLIADEPTTALDVTIQAQILELLRKLQDQLDMSIVLITHDLGVVAESCDEVVVMYAGRVVERAPVGDLFSQPRHPYSEGLLLSMPGAKLKPGEPLQEIPGMVPPPHDLPKGCKFQDRCNYVQDKCRASEPELTTLDAASSRQVRCFFPVEATT